VAEAMVMNTYDPTKQNCSKSMTGYWHSASMRSENHRVADRRNLPNLYDASTHGLLLLLRVSLCGKTAKKW
jgi:hypothetical protein